MTRNASIKFFYKRIDFTNLFIALDGKEYVTLEAAKAAETATINYGLFITGVINFVIMAFVVFLLVEWMNKLRKSGCSSSSINKKMSSLHFGYPCGCDEMSLLYRRCGRSWKV